MDWTDKALIDSAVSYGLSFLTALVVLVAGIWLSRWLSRMAGKRLEEISGFDKTLIPIIVQVVRYSLLALTIIIVLAQFGVQTASIITILGAAGLAIGLALQGTLQNVAAGIMLLLLRPFRLGDFVEIGSTNGTVEEIGLFMTNLRTPQNIFVSIPNSKIFGDQITNFSNLARRRMDLQIGIAYEANIDQAIGVLKETIEAELRVLTEPPPKIFVKDLGDSAVIIEIRAWALPGEFWDVRFDLTKSIKLALDEAGISIPYPHRRIIMSQENMSALQAPTQKRARQSPPSEKNTSTKPSPKRTRR